MAQSNALGDFLRARRDQVHPQDVGLVPGGPRRAPGLRREELALLAGISAEYYLRLERGRAQHPSPQIIEALARALKLDAKTTRYLHSLADPRDEDTSEADAAAHGLAEVIDHLTIPAIVTNRYRDVLAANAIARALSPEFTPGQNSLRWRLLDPAARRLFVNWEEATEIIVSGFRELSGSCPTDPRMRQMIDELSDASPRFRELWGRAEVGYRLGIHHIRHPHVGELYLYRHRLNAPYPGGDHVLAYRAEQGSESARALEELRRLAAPASAPAIAD